MTWQNLQDVITKMSSEDREQEIRIFDYSKDGFLKAEDMTVCFDGEETPPHITIN